MKFFTALAAVGVTVSLSACNTDVALEDIDLTVEQANALFDRTINADKIMPGITLPSSATMSGYIGVETSILGENVVTGNLDMIADFAASKVTGTATNFAIYNTDGVSEGGGTFGTGTLTEFSRIDGSLELDGIISRNPNNNGVTMNPTIAPLDKVENDDFGFELGTFLAANLSGTLTGEIPPGNFEEDDVTFVAEVNADISGEFLKDDDGLFAVGVVGGYTDVTPSFAGVESGVYWSAINGFFSVTE